MVKHSKYVFSYSSLRSQTRPSIVGALSKKKGQIKASIKKNKFRIYSCEILNEFRTYSEIRHPACARITGKATEASQLIHAKFRFGKDKFSNNSESPAAPHPSDTQQPQRGQPAKTCPEDAAKGDYIESNFEICLDEANLPILGGGGTSQPQPNLGRLELGQPRESSLNS